MAEMLERYDSALIGILQNEGQIARFLDVIYGFLYRKTDFYVIMKEKTATMGFPEGTALKLTVGAFNKYQLLAAKNEERRLKQTEAARVKVMQAKLKDDKKKQQEKAIEKVQCDTSVSGQHAAGSEKKAIQVVAGDGDDTTTTVHECQGQATPMDTDSNAVPVAIPEMNCATVNATESKTSKSKTMPKSSGDQSDDDDPELTKQQKLFQMKAESYNGAARDNYTWSQSITDVDVQVKVPQWVRKGNEVKVEISKKHLKVSQKDKAGAMVTVVDDDLTWDINKEESMWSLVPGEHIHVNLEKIQDRWWEGLLKDEPKISVRKIDPSRPITDLDEEAQAKIEEMMFNEQQKRLGKPQSHERKVHDMLKNAWDMEGSPFKGQPFDPSLVNIQNPGDFKMGGGGPPPNAPPQ